MKTAVTRFKASQIDVLGIIYQFNFNDITPYSKQDLLNLEHIDPAQVNGGKHWCDFVWNISTKAYCNVLCPTILQDSSELTLRIVTRGA